MADIQNVSPLLDNWEIGELISENSNAKVYSAVGKIAGKSKLCVVKHITIPGSATQVQALIFSGCVKNEAEAHDYYAQIVSDLETELKAVQSFVRSPNIMTYHGYQIVEKADMPGYDVYLLMDYCDTLQKYINYHAMTHLRAINLGIDICTALEDFRGSNLIHRGIKPENIFINQYDQYMLGDLGAAKLDQTSPLVLPSTHISDYAAPELDEEAPVPNNTIDTYSLGMILYRVYNGNHAPFEDEKTSAISANKMRMNGEPLPVPLFADYELSEIILKACAFKPEDRYQTPQEFKKALIDYSSRNTIFDELIVPPIYLDPEEKRPDLDEKMEPLKLSDDTGLDQDFIESFSPDEPAPAADDDEIADKPQRKKRPVKKIAVIAAIILVVLAGAAFAAMRFWPTVEIMEFYVEDAGAGELTVTWSYTGYENKSWLVSCSDAYGNQTETQTFSTSHTFTNLKAATKYNISIKPVSEYIRVRGTNEISTKTISSTELTSFKAAAISSTTISLDWLVSGTEPDSWVLTYQSEDASAVSTEVVGNSAKISGLEPNTTYHFELSTNYLTELQGETMVICTTLDEIDVQTFSAKATNPSTVELDWSFSGVPPEIWTVHCTGNDGSQFTESYNRSPAVITNLNADVEYSFILSAGSSIYVTGETTVTATTPYSGITSIETEAASSSSVSLVISLEGVLPEELTVSYGYDGATALTDTALLSRDDESASSSTATVILNNLLPEATYHIALSAPEEFQLTGETELTYTTPAAPAFTDYGCRDISIALYDKPDADIWTESDLGEEKTSFSPQEEIAFAVSATYDETENDKNVTTLYVVRNTDGRIISYYAGTRSWGGSWKTANHTGSLENTPHEPGIYTLEIYFDQKLLASAEFEIQ